MLGYLQPGAGKIIIRVYHKGPPHLGVLKIALLEKLVLSVFEFVLISAKIIANNVVVSTILHASVSQIK